MLKMDKMGDNVITINDSIHADKFSSWNEKRKQARNVKFKIVCFHLQCCLIIFGIHADFSGTSKKMWSAMVCRMNIQLRIATTKPMIVFIL